MSIQQDVLDAIGTGGIEARLLRGKIGNIGQVELDCAINALLRARRVSLSFGRYELLESKRPLGNLVGIREPLPPPTAAEEAAASLNPKRLKCATCLDEKPESSFHVLHSGERSPTCRGCHGIRTAVGRRNKLETTMETPKGPALDALLPAGAKLARAELIPPDAAQANSIRRAPPTENRIIERMRQRQSEVAAKLEMVAEEVRTLEHEANELEQAIAVFNRFAQATA